MSSTGTRKERNVQSRTNEAITEGDKALIAGLKNFSESSNPVAGLGGASVNNSPKTPTGNFLARKGDSMIGPFALGPPIDFRIEVDANNTIDIGPFNNNPQYSSNVQLDDLQPNSSVLDVIANAAFDGQILILRTFAPTVPYTISQATLANGGNIQTGDSNDLTVGDLQTVVLVFDASLIVHANTGGTWRIVSVSSGGGGTGLSEPVILTINTITPQTLPTKSTIDWSKNPNHITIDRDVEFDFSNLPTTGKYEGVLVIIDIDATGGYATPVWPASLTNPPIVPTTANTRTSVLIYTIDNGTTVTHATSVGSSTGGGGLNANLSNMVSPTIPPVALSMNSKDILLVDRLQMSGGTTSATSVNDVVWYLDAAGDLISNINATDAWAWSSGNVVKMILNDSTLEKRNVTAPTFQLYNTRPAAVGTAGTFGILANSTMTSTGVPMAFLIGNTENIASDGTGSLSLGVRVAGVPTNFLTLNDSEDGVVKILKDLDINANDLLYAGTGNKLQITSGLVLASISSTEVFRYSDTAIAFKQTLSMNSKKITGVLDPTSPQDVATKNYVDVGGAGNPLTTQGDLFGFDTGAARIPIGTTNGDVLTVDSAEALGLKWAAAGGGSFLPLAGGTMTGAINMGNNDLTAVDDIIFNQANTSIEIAADIVTHDFPSGGTWRIRELATSRVIIDSAFRITSSTNIGVFGSTAVAKQTVTGSRGGNAALASLLTAMANFGWITDSTTA